MTPPAAPRERLVDYAFRVAWATTRHAPEPVATRLLEGVADRVWRRHGTGVRQLEANLRRAVPGASEDELRELSREAMRSYFRYWHEVFRLPTWSPSRAVDSVVTTGEDGLRAGFAGGRGAIIALPHMANWDHAGAWACLTGMPVSTVAERLRPESLFTRFVRYREELGMEVIALTGSGNAMATLRSSLAAGRLVCLLADRTLNGSGIEVDLLGERARLPGGPAALSRITGAPMVALTLTYRGPLMQLDFSPPIPPRPGKSGLAQMTQEVADWFTTGIRADPTDWHMLQSIFTADFDQAAVSSANDVGGPDVGGVDDVAGGDGVAGHARVAGAADILGGRALRGARVGDGPERSEPERPDTERPHTERPDTERPDTERPDPVRPDPERLDLERPDPESSAGDNPRVEPNRDRA